MNTKKGTSCFLIIFYKSKIAITEVIFESRKFQIWAFCLLFLEFSRKNWLKLNIFAHLIAKKIKKNLN